jgi:hypothetical protein
MESAQTDTDLFDMFAASCFLAVTAQSWPAVAELRYRCCQSLCVPSQFGNALRGKTILSGTSEILRCALLLLDAAREVNRNGS